jgi:hypothetical protein
MFKKVLVPIILALVIALPFSGVAYAAGMPGITSHTGKVLSVDLALNTFKFQTGAGAKLTIHVDSSTVYTGAISGLAAIAPNAAAKVSYRTLASGEYMATRILVRPETRELDYINGKVTAINAGSFILKGDNGITYTFHVLASTRFQGQGVPHFRELKDGMIVRVTYRDLGKGVFNAVDILVRK